jgi:hypothetical protein
LSNGELAINQADGKLYYRNSSGVVTLLTSASVTSISFGSTGLTPNTATNGAVTVAGTLAVANGGTNRTVGNYSIYANEIHVGKDGNDTTGDGTLINPVLTITKALTLISAGRNTVVVHPGSYSESPTVSSTNTTIETTELTGANTQISGTLTTSAACRLSGLKITNLTITGSGNTYISNCTVDTRLIKSGSNYVEIINSELQCTLGVQISGAGAVSILGNKNWSVAVSNASANVLIKDAIQVLTPSVTAGTLNIDGCAVFASSPASNAITSGTGSFITLANSYVLNSVGTNVERISLAGSYSILNLVYDKTNSTFTGSTNLNAIDYFSVINADTLSLTNALSAPNGGTGQSTFTLGDLLYASSTTALSKLAAGTATYVLTSNGPGTAPSWQASGGGGGGVTTISFGTTGLTPSTATGGVVTVAGTLIAVNGGTGISSYAQGEMLYANTTTTLDKVTANITTSKKYLSQTGNGTAGLAPTWGDVTATNIAGGTAGTLFYNTAADTTTTLSIGTAYQLLGVNAGATAPSWQGLSSLIDNVFTASAQGTVLYRGASNWVALAPGTNGQFLTSGGTSANVSWTTGGGGGGVTGFTTALNTASPNVTSNVSSITASGGTTNQYFALIPKGTGGIIAAIPDSTLTGGNVRGTYSVDLQLARSGASQVASGQYSALIGGADNKATNSSAGVVAGTANTVSSIKGGILAGDLNTISGACSVALGGTYGNDRGAQNAVLTGAAGSTSTASNQTRMVILMATTTDATSTVATTNNLTASGFNQLNLDNNTAFAFRVQIVATVRTGAGNMKAWTITGAIKRGASAATTALVGTPSVNIDAADTGASTWTVSATADATNGTLSINCVGQAATNIRWNCVVTASEAAAS